MELLHSLIGWKNTWMIIILMHLTLFWSRIIGHEILTYVIGEYLIWYLMLACMGHIMSYSLGCTSTFMIFWWGTFMMHICMMLLCTFIIYILYSWCFEGCNTNNGILELFGFISLGVAIWLLVWESKPTFSYLSSSLQRSVPISCVGELLRDGFNFQMLGVHRISS